MEVLRRQLLVAEAAKLPRVFVALTLPVYAQTLLSPGGLSYDYLSAGPVGLFFKRATVAV